MYQATLLFPPDYDLAPLKAAMLAAAQAEWGGNMPAMGPQKNPIKPCENKPGLAGYEPDWHFVNTKSEYQPSVVDERLQEVIDPSKIFPGCWVRLHINSYTYDHSVGGKGISFGLNSVQFVRKDERLDGRVAAKDVFAPIEVAEGATAAGDTAGPAAATGGGDGADLFG